jgi:hypothetical protein
MNDIYTKKLDELKSKLPIDKYHLDEECRNQAVLYDEVGDLYVQLKTDARIAKEHLEFVRAKLSMDIRKNPNVYGMSKITEDSVEATIRLQKEFELSNNESIELSGISDSFSILLSSVEQRKSMLKDLVSLHIYQYFNEKQTQDLNNVSKRLDNIAEEKIIEMRNNRSNG